MDAHEVWEFDIPSRTQTLKAIVALCSACHGVKHMRNSQRIGYGDQSKDHFMKINQCSAMVYATHFSEQQFLFEERNKVLRWKMVADLSRFGGKGIEVKERSIPNISNPYDGLSWNRVMHPQLFKVIPYQNLSQSAHPPYVQFVEVNNYEGTIIVTAFDTNRIQWLSGNRIIKTKYNIIGKFITQFSVEDLDEPSVHFRLIGDSGEIYSQEFVLQKYT